MTGRTALPSPRFHARIAGVLYLIIIVCGIAGELFIRGSLIVRGDAAATAASILASPGLFRVGFLADSLMFLCDAGLAVLLFVLLRPVNFTLALLALCLRLTQTAVIAANLLNYHAALLVLGGPAPADPAQSQSQSQSLALLYLDLHAHGYDLGLLLFGIHCLVLGQLIRRSGFLPRTLGFLMWGGGCAYLVGSYTRFLLPQYLDAVQPVYALALVAELALCLWLLIRGVDAERWRERAGNSSAAGALS